MVSKFIFDIDVTSKEELLKHLAKVLVDDQVFSNVGDVYNELIEREKVVSTGVGLKIALPHLQTNNSLKEVIYYFTTKNPVDYEAIDSIPIEIGFLIISSNNTTSTKNTPKKGLTHLEILSKLSLFLLNNEIYDKLLNGSNEEVKKVVMEELS